MCTRIAMLCSLLALTSCSLRLTHGDGSTTYVGILNLREGDAPTAPFVHSRRAGVMLDAGRSGNGVALGYEDRLIVRPPDNATTTLDYSPGNGKPNMNIKPEP